MIVFENYEKVSSWNSFVEQFHSFPTKAHQDVLLFLTFLFMLFKFEVSHFRKLSPYQLSM